MHELALRTLETTSIVEAAQLLAEGRLVAFATETVYGLGVDATNASAVQRLFEAKGRPGDNPLIVHLSDWTEWSVAASLLTPSAEALLRAFSPGPITVVLPKHARIVDAVAAGLSTVAIRVPDSAMARELIQRAKCPIAAPSANKSGRPSCTTWRSVKEDLAGRIDAILCLDMEGIGLESTVVDCCGEVPKLLRPGGISLEDIRRIIPEAIDGRGDLGLVEEESGNAITARSPGLRHAHYQPRAKVILIEGVSEIPTDALGSAAVCVLGKPDHWAALSNSCMSRSYATVQEFARDFYEFLRESDRRGAVTIYCQLVPEGGLGTALRDRQQRAAGVS